MKPLPKDELEMNQDTDRLIQVVHYYNTPNDFHGIPFRFVAIKVSLQSRIKTAHALIICSNTRVNHLKKLKRDYKRGQDWAIWTGRRLNSLY